MTIVVSRGGGGSWEAGSDVTEQTLWKGEGQKLILAAGRFWPSALQECVCRCYCVACVVYTEMASLY